ncbi:DUF2971 domain-containing protein [Neptunomonas phycophila]|uniref:DUF2971 domain-containing protein n=1 Tax=Neptunomonas phycophila TaxID=1572645 RepID=A0ABT9EWR7_9GAMM|nr:DUF2971 domain-containing protein [Neptunomonas phycophila]MDP2523500.1 DUF2971 domain-containing protein [Neptunomonas phycophila]
MDENLIYRFRSLANGKAKREIDALKNKTLWFSDPESLNDCQEFMVNLNYDCTSTTRNELWKDAILRCSSIKSSEEQVEEMSKTGRLNSIIRNQFVSVIDHYTPLIRTCSFSISNCSEGIKNPINNAMMWGHYTNALEGCALGFDKDILEKHFKSLYANYANAKVDYIRSDSKLPTIESAELSVPGNYENEFFRPLLLKKSDDWEYEQEYRLILAPPLKDKKPDANSVINTLTYTDNALKRIVIGSKLKIDILFELHKILPSQVEFFIAHRSNTHYRIDIKPFDRQQLNKLCSARLFTRSARIGTIRRFLDY